MLTRIVKLTFREDFIPQFLENFDLMKEKIRNAPGNRLLELQRDLANPCIFFTYSHWESEQDLNNYRDSELFYGVWQFTKQGFAARPEAWSTDVLVRL